MVITKSQSRVLALSVLAVFFGVSIILIQSSRRAQKARNLLDPSQVTVQEEPSQVSLNNFHRSETKDGVKLWEVTAERGQYFAERNQIKVTKAKFDFYKKDGTTIRMISDQALLSLSGASLNKAEASGSVTISYNDTLKIATEALSYDKEGNSVFAPGHVRITSETLDTEGEELSVDLETEHFTLSRSVKSTLRPKTSPLPVKENQKP